MCQLWWAVVFFLITKMEDWQFLPLGWQMFEANLLTLVKPTVDNSVLETNLLIFFSKSGLNQVTDATHSRIQPFNNKIFMQNSVLAIFEGRYSRMTSYCILEIIVWSLHAYTWLSYFLHYSFLSTFFLFFFHFRILWF